MLLDDNPSATTENHLLLPFRCPLCFFGWLNKKLFTELSPNEIANIQFWGTT
jgi:hypothetical protein